MVSTRNTGNVKQQTVGMNAWSTQHEQVHIPQVPELLSCWPPFLPSVFPSYMINSHLHSDITIAEYREWDYIKRSLTPILYFKKNQHVPESIQRPLPLIPRSSRGPPWKAHSPFQNEETASWRCITKRHDGCWVMQRTTDTFSKRLDLLSRKQYHVLQGNKYMFSVFKRTSTSRRSTSQNKYFSYRKKEKSPRVD